MSRPRLLPLRRKGDESCRDFLQRGLEALPVIFTCHRTSAPAIGAPPSCLCHGLHGCEGPLSAGQCPRPQRCWLHRAHLRLQGLGRE
jgi:hypothetical protein